jgi:hypothetical protein
MNNLKSISERQKLIKGKTLVVGTLLLVLLTGTSSSPAVAEESVDVGVEVVVSNSYSPPCAGSESPAIWAPDTFLTYDGGAGPGSVDLNVLSSTIVGLSLNWLEGQDDECFPISHTGTVTASLTMVDPGVDVTFLDCDGAPACNAVDMLDITAELEFGGLDDGTYTGTLSVTWVP